MSGPAVDIRQLFLEMVEKAVKAGVKYIRRTGEKGNYRYYYADNKGGKKRAKRSDILGKKGENALHKGAAISNGQGGHYHVDDVEGTTLHLTLTTPDGNTHKLKMKKKELRSLLEKNHLEAFKHHAEYGLQRRQEILKGAIKVGSEKHIARAQAEVERWEKAHGEYLPKGQARRHMFAAGREHGFGKEELRDLLGVESISKEATEEQMRDLAYRLQRMSGAQAAQLLKSVRGAKEKDTSSDKPIQQDNKASDKKRASIEKGFARAQERMKQINERLETAQRTGNKSYETELQKEKASAEEDLRKFERRLKTQKALALDVLTRLIQRRMQQC